MDIYIINASDIVSGGRIDHYIVGLENALAEYEDCKKEGECPNLYATEIAPTGLIMCGKLIK